MYLIEFKTISLSNSLSSSAIGDQWYKASQLSLNGFSDVKADDTDFSKSILLGQSTTGDLDAASINVGLGYGVFSKLESGSGNMATGFNALNSLTSGSGNVAIGRQVISKLTTGSKNVGIGRQGGIVSGNVGGNSLVSGSQNTYIGAETVPSASDASNETVIGYGTTAQGSSTSSSGIVTIGNSSVDKIYLSQDKGATVYTGALEVAATAGITLENEETITNSADGTVEIGGNLSGTGSLSGFNADIPSDVTANYTLATTDNGKVILMNSGSALTLTIPASTLATGFNCLIVQKGSGKIQITHASGSDYIKNRSSEVYTAGQYAVVSIINIGGDLFIVSGDTSGS